MKKRHKNPFYVLLILVGVAFTISACSYFVMVVKQSSPSRWEDDEIQTEQPRTLISLMERHGFAILMTELAVLAVLTCAAILTDDYWEGETQPSEGSAEETKETQ